MPGATDPEVLQMAEKEGRLLLTEDKDFGEWIFAHGALATGVLFFRYPSRFRNTIAEMACEIIRLNGDNLFECFTVIEVGRYRIRKHP